MTEVVVDTGVVSFIFKNHSIGSLYDPEVLNRVTLISFMTVAEVERWALQSRWSTQLSLKRFAVVPSSPDLCLKWAEVTVAARAAVAGLRAAESAPSQCRRGRKFRLTNGRRRGDSSQADCSVRLTEAATLRGRV